MKHPQIAGILALALLAGVPTTATALAPTPVEVRAVTTLPLAVTTVSHTAIEPRRVEGVVTRLNRARVPVTDTVEIVRYTPFELVVTEVRPAAPADLSLDFDLDGLDMLWLLDRHLDNGLEGPPLASAVLSDLLALGFDVSAGGGGTVDRWRPAPLPVERDFLYYVEPGYRYTTDRGLFLDRVVTVEPDWVDGRIWRDRTWYDDHDGYVAGLPPGHVKHDGPGGPPGHAMHDGPGGPPGHAKHDPDLQQPRQRARGDGPPPRARGNQGNQGNQGRGNAGDEPPGQAKKDDRQGPPPGQARGNQGNRGRSDGNADRGNRGRGNGQGGGNGNGKGIGRDHRGSGDFTSQCR